MKSIPDANRPTNETTTAPNPPLPTSLPGLQEGPPRREGGEICSAQEIEQTNQPGSAGGHRRAARLFAMCYHATHHHRPHALPTALSFFAPSISICPQGNGSACMRRIGTYKPGSSITNRLGIKETIFTHAWVGGHHGSGNKSTIDGDLYYNSIPNSV